MKCDRHMKELQVKDVGVVAGFQGAAKNGDITTIGRGGSDTSAAALGAALQAERVDIFTDVEGIMTADPRIADQARPLSIVSYTEVCNMAYQGAKVIHPRAVEIAMQAKVPIRIRSTYSEGLGTLVTSVNKGSQGSDIRERLVTGIAHVPSDGPGAAAVEERAHVRRYVPHRLGPAHSLELAVAGVPMVTTYVMDGHQARVFKKLGRPLVALPNIILDRPVVPEIISAAPQPAAVIEAACDLLDSGTARQDQADAFSELAGLMTNGAPEAPRQDPAERVLAHWRRQTSSRSD
jgi:hypothetical protein